MKTLGIIGGLGPMATALFMEMITRMTAADCDQKHLHLLIDSNPRTPDRTAFLLEQSSEDPYPYLLKGGRNLKQTGAELLAMPCNTAHAFADRLSSELELPLIHMIRETASVLKANGIKRTGLMATNGTVGTGLYQRELKDYGIEVIAPDAALQEDVNHLIYKNIKANLPAEMDRFFKVTNGLASKGAEVVILGCTELSVIKKQETVGPDLLDAMEVLASACVKACEAQLADGFKELITR